MKAQFFRNRLGFFQFVLIFALLYFAFVDEAADTFLINASSKILYKKDMIQESTLVYLLLGLQIVFSPLQAGFSDYYLRRRSIIVALIATLISIFLFKLSILYGSYFLLIAIIFKGILGNTLPIAWAGIADITKKKNVRFVLALSICALAVGSWGSLLISPYLTINLFFRVTLTLIIIAILYAIYPFKDSEDSLKPIDLKKTSIFKLLGNECIGIYEITKKPLTFFILLAFFFSEVSFYQLLFRVEVFNEELCFSFIPLSIGIGYSIGTFTLKFIKSKDRDVSLTGLLTSLFCVLGLAILFYFESKKTIYPTTLFAGYSFGYALFTPAIFSLITPKDKPHLQGKIYGILESTDSLASLITFALVFLTSSLSCLKTLLISVIFLIIGMLFFRKTHEITK